MEKINNTSTLACSLRTAADRLGLSVSFLEKQIKAGELRAIKFGKATRIEEADLRAYVASRPTAENDAEFDLDKVYDLDDDV